MSEGEYPARYPDLYIRPAQSRAMFLERGWSNVAAFQTRNPMHRSHEHLVKIAVEVSDGVFIHQVLGKLKAGDIPADVRARAIQAMIDNYFRPGTVIQAGYPIEMRYAGPREALMHALIRQNFGCSHLIVGRDHAGVGDYYGPFDAHHIFVLNYLYALPFFKQQSGFVGKVLGGWQISGIVQAQTGLPCSVAGSNDYAGVGLDSNFGCGVNGQYWVVNGDPKIIGTFGPSGQWFATQNPDGSPIFTQPAPGTFNTQHVRNLIFQPGFQNWNMGLFKKINVTERLDLQFRAEAFNVWNHPNWCAGNGSGCNGTNNVGFNPTSAATFGKILTKSGERNLQLSLRAEF